MALVRTLADHVFVLHNGRLLAEGSVAGSRPTAAVHGDLRGRARNDAVPRLEFEGVAGGYGDVDVVRGSRVASQPGEVLCVIGRNGVGKSTLMKLLFGELPCRAGSVRFEGRSARARGDGAARARHQLLPAGSDPCSTTSASATTSR